MATRLAGSSACLADAKLQDATAVQVAGSGDAGGGTPSSDWDKGGSAKGSDLTDTLLALLSLQLGWGLWLMPHSYGQLGWLPGLAVTLLLAVSTAWSGTLFSRLYAASPGAVLFGDIGQKAAGPGARLLVYLVVYALDATRCVILQLAATQSLRHALGAAGAGGAGASAAAGGAAAASAAAGAPLWKCGAAVVAAMAAMAQVRSLSSLSGFFALGTAAQLAAVAVVGYQMSTDPIPGARRALAVRPEGLQASSLGGVGLDDQVVAAFNVIFAFGGQFAFVELMSAMAKPSQFPVAISACTAVMSVLYIAMGASGYLACGSQASEILVFSFREGAAARAAGAFVLLQALAQYLVNTNVWSHNLLVLIGRHTSRGKQSAAARRPDNTKATDVEALIGSGECPSSSPGGGGGRSNSISGGSGVGAGAPACSNDHARLPWLLVTSFVIASSYVVAMTIPFFSTLVGIVSSSTYLLCAYTLPCWFALRLLPQDLGRIERAACRLAIPLTLALSALGLVCSVSTLASRVCARGKCSFGGAGDFGASAGA